MVMEGLKEDDYIAWPDEECREGSKTTTSFSADEGDMMADDFSDDMMGDEFLPEDGMIEDGMADDTVVDDSAVDAAVSAAVMPAMEAVVG